MRSSLIARLVLLLTVVAVIGVPGVQQFEPPTVEAHLPEPTARSPMPPGDV